MKAFILFVFCTLSLSAFATTDVFLLECFHSRKDANSPWIYDSFSYSGDAKADLKMPMGSEHIVNATDGACYYVNPLDGDSLDVTASLAYATRIDQFDNDCNPLGENPVLTAHHRQTLKHGEGFQIAGKRSDGRELNFLFLFAPRGVVGDLTKFAENFCRTYQP